MRMDDIADVRSWLADTNAELEDMDKGNYPDLGLTYGQSVEVLRDSYRKTMEAQRERLEERLAKLERDR
jgi:hypothetical protein